MELSLVQQQKLFVSQKMQQSVKVLQMSSQELNDYIMHEAEQNPAIDIDSLSSTPDSSYESLYEKIEWLASKEVSEKPGLNAHSDEKSDADTWNFNMDRGQSLSEFLLEQIRYADIPECDRQICEYIALCVNSRGFLGEKPAELAQRFGLPLNEINRLLSFMQSLEPCGVCAEDLKHCLLIQLDKIEDSELAKAIVSDHLEALAKNRLSILAEKLGLPLEEINRSRDIILSLNPNPGCGFGSGAVQYVYPDVVVSLENGVYDVSLANRGPAISISNYFKNLFTSASDDDARKYVLSKMSQAEHLKNCINQRNSTLLRVSSEIVREQQSFFAHGPDALKPLCVTSLAEKLGMHESTVSRTLRGKYLLCNWGIYEMIKLFPSGVQASDGTTVTPGSIKNQIKQIIKAENKSKPFSDRELCEILSKRGCCISRRTVAKYRESMGIHSAPGRKIAEKV